MNENRNQLRRDKNRLLAGSDPILSALRGPKFPRVLGSLPATFGLAVELAQVFATQFCARESLLKRLYFTRRIVMPLLRPPDPQVPKRKLYLRIEEPLAAMLDRYAEFLGTTGVDHVVNQALEFVFRKDTDFKEWLSQNPQPGLRRPLSQRMKAKSVLNSVRDQHGPQESEVEGASRV